MAGAQQRRGRSIAMTPAELDEFLAQARTCRVATLAPDGPHVVPLWFVWAGGALWLSSVVRSQRWADLIRDPRVAVVVDAGEEYHELRGAEIKGTAEPVGEVPRHGADDARLATPELLFARKYLGGDSMLHDGRHGWLASRRARSPAGTSASCRPSASGREADPAAALTARPRHPASAPGLPGQRQHGAWPACYVSGSSTGVRPGWAVFCSIHASIRAHQS